VVRRDDITKRRGGWKVFFQADDAGETRA